MRTMLAAAACAVVLATLMIGPGCDGGDGGTTSEGTSTTTTTSGGGAGGQGGADTTTGTAGGGGRGGEGGGGQGGGQQAGCEGTMANGLVLAANALFLGETAFDGTPSPTAWRQIGFNVDGLVSTPQSQNVCQPRAGATMQIHDDGDTGVDNAFGKSIVPILSALVPSPSDEATTAILEGRHTMLVHLEGLGQAPTQTMIPARVYAGSEIPAPPAFDGSDCRPVDPVSLQDPADVSSAAVLYPESLVVSNEWSSGAVAQAPLALRLFLIGYSLDLTIHQPRMRFDLSAAHDGAVNGHLGGLLLLPELEEAFRRLFGTLDPALCSGATVESIMNQIRQASDILADGTQDPAQTCDAITIGVGFTMAPVQLGAAAAPTPVVDPCMP